MANAGVIAQLVSQLASGQQPGMAIIQLSKVHLNDAHKTSTSDCIISTSEVIKSRVLATPGAVEQLEALVDDEDTTARRAAINITAHMMLGDKGFRVLLGKPERAGFLRSIIRQADTSTDHLTQTLAVVCLGNVGLELSNASKTAANAGAVEVLIRLLDRLPATPDKEDVRVIAAQGIYNFTNHSTSTAKLATAAGVMQPLSRLAMSPSFKAQKIAIKCLWVFLCAETNPTKLPQPDTKLAIAALARLVVRGSSENAVPTTGNDCSAPKLAAVVLSYISTADKDASTSISARQQGLREIRLDIAKALAHAKAGPTLLRMHDNYECAMQLLTMMFHYLPDQYATIADDDSIRTLRQLLQHPVPRVRYLGAVVLNCIKRSAPELFSAIGVPHNVVLKELESCEAVSSEAEAKIATCAKCAVQVEKELRCSACQKVVYCSKGCQTAHWKLHKPDCVQNMQDLLFFRC